MMEVNTGQSFRFTLFFSLAQSKLFIGIIVNDHQCKDLSITAGIWMMGLWLVPSKAAVLNALNRALEHRV